MLGKLAKLFSKGGPTGPKLHLAAFGKHPGWDDHIDEIGLTSPRLVSVKSALYTRGISENIDSAMWDQMPEDQRLPGFDHEFLWRWPDESAVGLIWSSRDGKGRSKYPMILCLHAEGFGPGSGALGWLRRDGLRVLREVKAMCVAAPDASGVRAAVEKGLMGISAVLPSAGTPDDESSWALRHVAKGSTSSDGLVGLSRVFYEMDQRLGALRPQPGKKTRQVDMQAKRFRVESDSRRGQLDDAWSWGEATLAEIGPGACANGMLAIEWRREPGHTDIIVGDPDPGCLFCLRASRQREPLTSEIPFNIEAGFQTTTAAKLAAWLGSGSGNSTNPSQSGGSAA